MLTDNYFSSKRMKDIKKYLADKKDLNEDDKFFIIKDETKNSFEIEINNPDRNTSILLSLCSNLNIKFNLNTNGLPDYSITSEFTIKDTYELQLLITALLEIEKRITKGYSDYVH